MRNTLRIPDDRTQYAATHCGVPYAIHCESRTSERNMLRFMVCRGETEPYLVAGIRGERAACGSLRATALSRLVEEREQAFNSPLVILAWR